MAQWKYRKIHLVLNTALAYNILIGRVGLAATALKAVGPEMGVRVRVPVLPKVYNFKLVSIALMPYNNFIE